MKYFRDGYPDQLWQVDFKGPFAIEGQRMLALVTNDDNTRYLISCILLTSITVDGINDILKKLVGVDHKPSKILLNLGSQFQDIFEEGCKKLWIKVEYTPKHYHLSKGKVKRCIRTLNEEFVRLGSVFDRVDGLLSEFVRWYNFDRSHMGIGCV